MNPLAVPGTPQAFDSAAGGELIQFNIWSSQGGLKQFSRQDLEPFLIVVLDLGHAITTHSH